jgi:GNAT superfamily N-acetyltransferase
MRHMKFIVEFVLVVSAVGSLAQESARTVQYHSQDIIAIRAKLKYTTLIELPTTEKIMEAATGDKDFWIVDVVGNFCFVHPAKQGISSNLNLITDKGNIYSFTLQDISGSTTAAPDLKVIVEPADHSAIVAASGPPQFVPAAQDYDREMVLVAEHHPLDGSRPRIVGVGRLNKLRARNEAEVAVLVADEYQNLGLGFRLLGGIVQVARDEKLGRVSSEMLRDNLGMQKLSKRLGFRLRPHSGGESVAAVLEL